MRLTPVDGDPWDVVVGHPGWWRTPAPDLVAVLSDGRGYLADVRHRRVVGSWNAIRIAEDEQHDLLLVIDRRSIVAWRHGVIWTSADLVVDDLKVDAITRDAIRCSGWNPPHRVEVALDPATGAVL